MTNIKEIQDYYMTSKGDRQYYLDRYYNNDNSIVPIYSRKSISPFKQETHTNMHTNFFNDIVSRKVGYFAQGISYKVNTELVQEKDLNRVTGLLKDLEKTTKQATMNSDSIKMSTVQGISHRLCYTVDGEFKIKNLDGWQVVYDYDNDIYDPTTAYYFYEITDMEGDIEYFCNVYDRTNVYYFQKAGENGKYYSIEQNEKNYQKHNFNQVPIIPFLNNSDSKSDCEDSVQIMDIYDEIISDTAGELKAARLAYLKIWGSLNTEVDEDGNEISVPEYLREFGTMIFDTDDLGNNLGDASFLEKSLDDAAIMNMKNTLRESIFEISSSIDLKQLTDTSSARVFTIKAALMRLENASKITENFTRMALNKQIDLWCQIISTSTKSKMELEWFDLQFKRSFVEDISAQAETLSKLFNLMQPIDAYRIAGFDDPEGIAKRMEEEDINLFDNPIKDDNDPVEVVVDQDAE